MKRKLLSILLVIGILGLAIAYYAYSEFNRKADSLVDATPEMSETTIDILNMCQELGEQAFNQEYGNKIVQLTGTLSGIDEKEDGSTILSLDDDGLSGVTVNLDERMEQNLPQLNQTITIVGKLSGCTIEEGDLLSGSTINLTYGILK